MYFNLSTILEETEHGLDESAFKDWMTNQSKSLYPLGKEVASFVGEQGRKATEQMLMATYPEGPHIFLSYAVRIELMTF